MFDLSVGLDWLMYRSAVGAADLHMFTSGICLSWKTHPHPRQARRDRHLNPEFSLNGTIYQICEILRPNAGIVNFSLRT